MEYVVPAGCTHCAPISPNLAEFVDEKEWIISPYTAIQFKEERKLGDRRIVTVSLHEGFKKPYPSQIFLHPRKSHSSNDISLSIPTDCAPAPPPPSDPQPLSASPSLSLMFENRHGKEGQRLDLPGLMRPVKDVMNFHPVTFPVFGVPLRSVMSYQGIGYIPYLVARCIQFLWNRTDVAELLKMEVNESDIENLVDLINGGHTPDFVEGVHDPVTVAHLLKKFFQDLPDPIFTHDAFDSLLKASRGRKSERVSSYRKVCDVLPVINHALLETLFSFLHRISSISEKHKEGAKNVAISFSDALLRRKDGTPAKIAKDFKHVTSILVDMIDFSREIFGVLQISSLEERFDLLDDLGRRGGIFSIRKCKDRVTGEVYAVKSVVLKGREMDTFRNEVSVLMKVRHPNAIQMYALCETPQMIHMVTEYVQGAELMKEIERRGTMSERDVCHVTYQLLNILDYLHSMGVIHRGSVTSITFFKIRLMFFRLINRYQTRSHLRHARPLHADQIGRLWHLSRRRNNDGFQHNTRHSLSLSLSFPISLSLPLSHSLF